MEDSPAAYIRLVHRLIEECILFNMSKEECMEALSKHANIKPVITSTVWKELEKENKEDRDEAKDTKHGFGFFQIMKTVTRTKQYWTKEQHRRIIIYMGPMGGINGFI
ncbi:hypothetical protein P8452_67098 [Trifolium repens]|nr:hypothetical protein P8452_67098 [Trifolium repens]